MTRGLPKPASRRSRARALAAIAATVAAALTPAAASALGTSAQGGTTGTSLPAGVAPAPRDVILSNETTSTTWTIANEGGAIHAQPSASSARMANLRAQTSDGFLQSYVLLRERFTSSGTWVELRIPGRPNGRVGWVPRDVLASFQKVHTELVVNRAARTLVLYRNGHAIYHAPVGVGTPGTPTPPGHFWITESFASSDPAYGPWAFGTSDFSTLTDWPGGGVVGLHGTNEPALVPGDPSHGCIRLHNGDALALSKLVHPGTPLLVE
jgi:lipoprotein-anchoring transpeptidase ErfK/SrfK